MPNRFGQRIQGAADRAAAAKTRNQYGKITPMRLARRSYVIWRKRLNQSVTIPNDITPGTVVAQDYTEWRNRFGKTTFDFGAVAGTSIPEPTSICLILIPVIAFLVNRINYRR